MGDRANFGFRDNAEAPVLFLYGHWAGDGMMANLANALDHARSRWDDPAYGTRICISQIIGDSWDAVTGWGLSINSLCDNEHRIPVVDWSAKTVTLYEEGNPLGAEVFSMFLEPFVVRYRR